MMRAVFVQQEKDIFAFIAQFRPYFLIRMCAVSKDNKMRIRLK